MNEWQGWAWLVAGLLIEWTLRSSLLCGVAWGAARLLRARSAAVRHAVWVGAFAGISLLPGLRFAAPSWEILPRLGGMWLTRFALEPTDGGGGAASNSARSRVVADSSALGMNWRETAVEANVPSPGVATREPEDAMRASHAMTEIQRQPTNALGRPASDYGSRHTWMHLSLGAVAVWLVGMSLGLLRIGLGLVRVAKLEREAKPLSETLALEAEAWQREAGCRRRVTFKVTTCRTIPMTWGIARPIVLLPGDVLSWSAERRRVVAMHELAHVVRWDCATQLAAELVRAVQWFNPCVWLALAKLREEQERACDDVVLREGADAAFYAGELLAISAGDRQPWSVAAVSLAMGRVRRVEQRIRNILEARRDRRPLTAWTRLGMLGVVLSLSVGVAAARTAPPPAAPVEEQASSKQKEAIQAAPAEKAPKDVPKDAAPTAKPVPRVEEESAADAVALVRARISQYATVPIDPQKLESAAIRGMLRALDDPFSDWLDERQMREVTTVVEGRLVGIGIILRKDGERLVVQGVLPESPAAMSGLKPQDELAAVGGRALTDLAQAVAAIRGPEGTEVTIAYRRDGKESSVTLRRTQVTISSVRGLGSDGQRFWLDPKRGAAYVQLGAFDRKTAVEMGETLHKLHASGLKGLVLDLRGNGGGILQSAIDVAKLWLREGTILEIRGKPDGVVEKLGAVGGGQEPWSQIPLVVLVDARTASSSEVLAGALKDHGRAVIVGERTFGKGSVQSIFPVGEAGGAVRLTTAFMVRPSGQPLDRRSGGKLWGVDPDEGYYVPSPFARGALPVEPASEKRRPKQGVRETESSRLPAELTPEFLELQAADSQLAAAARTLYAKLDRGEFEKTGRPLADQQVELDRIDELRRQRDAKRQELQELERALGE